MKIGFDIRCLAEGRRTGVEEYTLRMLKYLLDNDKENEYVLFNNSFQGSRDNLGWLMKYPQAEIRDFRFPNKLFNFFLIVFRWPKIDRLLGDVDLFFAPNISFIALSGNCRKILTIHDLSFERFGETFSFKRKLWHFIVNPRWLCQRFDKILTVSQSTKQDIVSRYRINPQKIHVFYPPLDFSQYYENFLIEEEKRKLRKRYKIEGDYLLYLGTIEPRKNIMGLVEAFELLKKDEKYRNLKLVIVGAPGWKFHRIYQRIDKSRFSRDIIRTNYLAQNEKNILLHLAKVFVFPSFFEGFGFPPLEAMACGVPVVASNCSSLPEVLDDAALLVDPYRPDEIALAIRHLLEDETLYQEYSNRGMERIKQLEKLQPEVKKILSVSNDFDDNS